MGRRMIPIEVVREVIAQQDWLDVEVIGPAPKSDNLGEECWGVFEHDGATYRVKFERGGAYWQSEMGPWEEPLPGARGAEVECEEVRAVEVVVVSYEPID